MKPLNLDPQPAWVGWALMPARLLVASFLHLEQSLKPDVPDDFGKVFRSRRQAANLQDERAIQQAVASFDAKHIRRQS
jgi:hypothetical protein